MFACICMYTCMNTHTFMYMYTPTYIHAYICRHINILRDIINIYECYWLSLRKHFPRITFTVYLISFTVTTCKREKILYYWSASISYKTTSGKVKLAFNITKDFHHVWYEMHLTKLFSCRLEPSSQNFSPFGAKRHFLILV